MMFFFLVIFPAAGNRKNNNNNYNEKKKDGADLEGLLPKSYYGEVFCIAREWFVL